jgi:hypothetical protein
MDDYIVAFLMASVIIAPHVSFPVAAGLATVLNIVGFVLMMKGRRNGR